MNWLALDTANCPVQRTLNLVGEKWSLLIIREAVNGVRKFDDFHDHLAVSEAVLADRHVHRPGVRGDREAHREDPDRDRAAGDVRGGPDRACGRSAKSSCTSPTEIA